LNQILKVINGVLFFGAFLSPKEETPQTDAKLGKARLMGC
jgi:hypothetical protein